MINKVVARKRDGTLIKGTAGDFSPEKKCFNIYLNGAKYEAVKICVRDLKAIFFVKTLEGDKHKKTDKTSASLKSAEIGRHVKVYFYDGELIEGFSYSIHLDSQGFYMTPADKTSNNERVFVVLESVERIIIDDQTINLTAANESERFCPNCGTKMNSSYKFCPYDGTKL
ncbi:MAG: zinc ribbon domain-containing protein [Nitrospiraceae bacterium]|nr:zinc ribbon domain-containing protein [Nitrospiraceae bacterium]